VYFSGPSSASDIFETDGEVAAPGWTLLCTEFMAELFIECEWKQDVSGYVKIWFATPNFFLDKPSHGRNAG
jgi:hypothetical protein